MGVGELVGAGDPGVLAEDTRMEGADSNGGSVEALLEQLRKEPAESAECQAKFQLYEGYAEQVEKIRGSLMSFHRESVPTVPPAVAAEMHKRIKSIDSRE